MIQRKIVSTRKERCIIPTYEYLCEKCDSIVEIIHMMSDSVPRYCEKCKSEMIKLIGSGSTIIMSSKTLAVTREEDHSKKVKDKDRAIKMRKKAFGHDAVGDPVAEPDPRHIIKGRTVGGAQKEVNKQEFIKAAAKDDYTVKKAQEALKKSKKKKK